MEPQSNRRLLRTLTKTLGVLTLAALLPVVVSHAHDDDKPNRHEDRFEHYEGTKTCLECHEEEAKTFFESQHYQWRGRTPDVVNTEEEQKLGKLTMINDFCTNPQGHQWIGKVKNEDGKVLGRGCSSCHAGLGKLPGDEATRDQLENIDCLMCHVSGYRRDLYKDEQDEWVWKPILWQNQEGMDIVSKRVSLPDRSMCLRCHSSSGGGPNFKRGDIEPILKDPDRDHDVHMDSDGPDMWCIDCHIDDTHTHRVIGRGVDMAATDRPEKRLTCTSGCHQDHKHQVNDLDLHMEKVACTTCHIPEFARDQETDMFRDWSQVKWNEEKKMYKYDVRFEMDVEPVYDWFNGKSFVQIPGRPVTLNDKGEVPMALPQGDRNDAEAKIYPFKLHRGNLPVLDETKWLAPVLTEKIFIEGDPEASVRKGASDLYGIENTDFTWMPTIRYMGINHSVPPADDALQCDDCHSAGGRMNWQELGYEKDPYPLPSPSEEEAE